MLSPQSYIGAVIIEQKNERVDETLILGKLIRWVGKWFLLVIVAWNIRKYFWSSIPVSRMEGAPFHVNNFMNRARLDKILTESTYTDELTPLSMYRLWGVIQMIRDCRDTTKETFPPSWLNCLDKSMCILYKK